MCVCVCLFWCSRISSSRASHIPHFACIRFLRVLHIPGELNYVADAILRKNFLLACQYVPDITISSFSPPQLPLGGNQKMISSSVRSRQPLRQPWTREHLFRERAIALGQAIDNSTWKNYSSALNSYLNFVKMHDFPLEPTSEMLSLFTVYMSHHNKPSSVTTYLSGICQQLEPYFPNVRSARNSTLVHRTLQGCRHRHTVPTSRKCALTLGDLEIVINNLGDSTDYDDRLFIAQLLTGFFALFCLGEMTYPDDPQLRDPRKVTKRNSVRLSDTSFQFFLPGHKADRFFEGNRIIVWKTTAFSTLTNSSPPTFASEMKNSLSAPPFGLQAKASYQRALSLSNAYVNFSIQTLPDNLYELEVPHHLQKMGFPLQSFKPSADGHPTPSKFTYEKTPSSSRHSCLDKQPARNLPLSTLWNPDRFSQTFPKSFNRLFSNWLYYLQTFPESFNPHCLPMDMDLSHQYGLTLFFLLAFFPSLLTSPTTWPHHTKLFPFLLTIFNFSLYRNIAIPWLETHRNWAHACLISDFLAILPHVHSEIRLCKHPLAQALLVEFKLSLLKSNISRPGLVLHVHIHGHRVHWHATKSRCSTIQSRCSTYIDPRLDWY